MTDFWGDVLLREYARKSKQRVVVTGGAGFLGSHLCELLVGEGHQVTCLDNFQTGRRENVSDLLASGRFELIEHDIVTPFGSRIRDSTRYTTSPARPRRRITRPIPSIRR